MTAARPSAEVRHKRGLPRRAVAQVLSGLIVGGGLVSCATDTSLSRLDVEAQRIVAVQEARSLGLTPPLTELPEVPDIPQPQPSLFAEDPDTLNPPPAALPASPGPVGGEVPYPAILDDGSQAATLRLQLEDILALGISAAPDYRREKEELFLTVLGLIVERHLWGPRFFSSITGRVDGTPENGDTTSAASLIASLGVTQRLPYGGTISAAALVDYVRLLHDASTNGLPDETQALELQLNLDLPLLRGAGMAAPTVESRLQAERDVVYAVRDFERFRRSFFVDLATTYFDLVRRQRQLANQELQLRNLENASTLFSALAEAGREPYFRAFRAQQRMLRARNSLLNQQESYVRQVDLLKLRLGIDTQRPVEIIPVELNVPSVMLDQDDAVQTGLNLRLDLQNVQDFIADAKRNVLIARNALLPDLNVFAEGSLPTDQTLQRGGLDLEAGDARYAAGVRLDLPLDRKVEYTDYRAALIRLERSERNYLVERDRVALQVRQSVRAIEQARFIVQLQEQAVEINERRAKQIEINASDLGPTEIIDVQEDLLDARNDRDNAVSNLRISILQYLLATGQIRVDEQGNWEVPGTLIPGDRPMEPTPLPEPAAFDLPPDLQDASPPPPGDADRLLR